MLKLLFFALTAHTAFSKENCLAKMKNEKKKKIKEERHKQNFVNRKNTDLPIQTVYVFFRWQDCVPPFNFKIIEYIHQFYR